MVATEHCHSLAKAPVYISPLSFVVRKGRYPYGSLEHEEENDPQAKVKHNAIPASAVCVSSRLYSGFLEHLGRCIYGGIVDDPKDPSPLSLLSDIVTNSSEGENDQHLRVRRDVLHELAAEMGIEPKSWSSLPVQSRRQRPLLRWPGGNYVSNYHWQDGIGPLSQRRKRIELAWGGTESNLFGTDEFVNYCRLLGVEPYICLNMGTGTMEEALAWLEYCNGKGDTYWANLRRKNTGRDEPHNVRYWGLGNELWGEWQVGRMSAEEYTRTAKRWIHALKLVDSSILLVSCGKEGGCEWDWTVLKGLNGVVDMHSIHFYTMLGHQKHRRTDEDIADDGKLGLFGSYEKNVFGAAAAEQYIGVCSHLIDLAEMEAYTNKPLEGLRDAVTGAVRAPIGICLDEYGVWDDFKGAPRNGLEQIYDYTDMLGLVGWLHVIVRNCDRVPIACLAQGVNVLSPLLTSTSSTLRQTIFYPISMFGKYFSNGALLNITKRPDVYYGPMFPAWAQQCARPAYVDIVAIFVPESGNIHVSVVNRHPTATFEAPFVFLDNYIVKSVEIQTVHSTDLLAKNTFENPHTIAPTSTQISGSEWEKCKQTRAILPHSWSVFVFEGSMI